MLSCLLTTVPVFAQYTQISGIVNQYAVVSGIDVCSNSVVISNGTIFAPGDRALMIQMNGAVADTLNGASFGQIQDFAEAGNYEFFDVGSVNGDTVQFLNAISLTYDLNFAVQLIRVAVYNLADVVDTLTCYPWNGQVGGVLALEVVQDLRLSADINTSEKGFSGGVFVDSVFACSWIFVNNDEKYTLASGRSSAKGEGISFTEISYEAGRGSLANGGGGGNDHNTGGGGGGNAGMGGSGAERITNSPLQCQGQYPGIGGKALPYDNTSNKVFMGGGGGAGHGNNNGATDGGNGGAIIFIRSAILTANGGTVKNNGASVIDTSSGDGAGGGGAGGTVVFRVQTISAPFDLECNGGNGGNAMDFNPEGAGGGGGGGGGVIWVDNSSLDASIQFSAQGGMFGINTTVADTAVMKSAGVAGSIVLNWVQPGDTSNTALPDAGNDLLICDGDSIQLAANGGLQYSWTPTSGLSDPMVRDPWASPTISTTYIVTIEDTANGCNATDSVLIQVMVCTSVAEQGSTTTKIYPNPAYDQLMIESSESGTVEARLVNAQGKLMSVQMLISGKEIHTLYTGEYPPGLYLLTLSSTSGRSTYRIIIASH